MKASERDKEKETDAVKDRTKEKDREKGESLQVVGVSAKHPSRSQSPALTDLRAESLPIMHAAQEPALSTSSKHSSERSHHSKSHSRDLTSTPGAYNSQQPPSRSMEDSPQKQPIGNLSSLVEYSTQIASPNALSASAYQSANVSFSNTGDEFPSPHPGYREHRESLHRRPVLMSSLSQPGPAHTEYVLCEYQTMGQGVHGDEGDCGPGGGTTRAATEIASLNKKVIQTRELIILEQSIRDDNVNEYLKLAGNADKQQLQRIKAVFEKKNQKSANSIAQLQKKLEGYSKRIKNWETHGSSGGQGSHRQPREMLRDMGQGLKNVGGNIRTGITGLGGTVMSKPREFAHLIKNKFGSADNINQMAGRNNWSEGRRAEGETSSGGAHTLPGALRNDQGQPASNSTGQPGNTSSNALPHHHKLTSEEGSESSSATSESIPGYPNQSGGGNLAEGVFTLKPIFSELQEMREEIETLSLKTEASCKAVRSELSYVELGLQEERFRSERLEEQINDLTELHQNEVENLKQALADVEEKVQYQSEERVRDIHEMLELCQTKISKMEHQAMQQQQYVNLEGIEGFNARVLAVKLINVVLTVLQVVLLLVATAAGILMPFLRTRDDLKSKYHNGNGAHGGHTQSLFLHTVRILTTSMVVIGAVFVLKQWPEVWEISSHLMEKLRKTIVSSAVEPTADR